MAVAAETLPGASAAVRAPLFRSLLERMEEGGRWVILDLGAARNETLTVFGRYRCRLDIADLADALGTLRVGEDTNDELLRERADDLLPPRRPEATDIVLCWDLLNYLALPAIAALSSRLAARALPGTLVHALIAYRDATMPTRPAGIAPTDDGDLRWRSAAPETCPAPRYSPEDLTRAMPEFAIERAVLLGNGMQEFLFRR